jgi:hypothetical protein
MPHQVEIIDSRFLICGATIGGTIIFHAIASFAMARDCV